MGELEKLKRKIRNAKELQQVVKIMNTLSAANIREYEHAAESLVDYNRTIEMGLQIVIMNKKDDLLAVEPATGKMKRLGALIFGSEQGLCGSFNELIVRFAIDKINEIEHEELKVLAVGAHLIPTIEEAKLPIDAQFSYSGHYPGITQVMLEVLIKIEMWREKEEVDQIVLFYNRPESWTSYSPHLVWLFPLDLSWLRGLKEKKWESRTLPIFTMDANELFTSLLREYIFFSLYRAFVESLAGENASRLRSMQGAESKIQEHLDELNMRLHRVRQETITSELLDIVTGYEALTED